MTHIPQISVTTAKRQVASARAQVTICNNALADKTMALPLRRQWQVRLAAKQDRLRAAEERLEAILSQEPDRRIPGAMARYEHPWSGINWTPEEEACFRELGL